MTNKELRDLIDRIEQVAAMVRLAELLGYREKDQLKRKAFGVQWKSHMVELMDLRAQLNEEVEEWLR